MSVWKKIGEALSKIKWTAVVVENGNLSTGRVMAWILFGILIYMWLVPVMVPETLMTTFLVLMSYNFGKKLADPLAGIVGKSVGKRMGASEAARVKSKDEEEVK